MVGPFHITPSSSWLEFLDVLANTAEVMKGSISMGGEGLKWKFQGKSAKLPLKDEKGFLTLKAQFASHKDPDSAIIIITLPTNTDSCRKAHAAPTDTKISHRQQINADDGTLWGQKVGTHCIDCTSLWY